jgi:hypothetical protein
MKEGDALQANAQATKNRDSRFVDFACLAVGSLQIECPGCKFAFGHQKIGSIAAGQCFASGFNSARPFP